MLFQRAVSGIEVEPPDVSREDEQRRERRQAVRAAAEACGADRRTLLANAALARFQNMARESVPDVLDDATGGEGADRGKGRED